MKKILWYGCTCLLSRFVIIIWILVGGPIPHGRRRHNGIPWTGESSAFPENENIGLLWCKHPYFWRKTSVLSIKEVRCFATSGPCFSPPPTKKVSENLLHFLHPSKKPVVFTRDFGWRIGCRIRCRMVDLCRILQFFLAEPCILLAFSFIILHGAMPYCTLPEQSTWGRKTT